MSRLKQISDIDLKLLRVFCEIVEQGSLASAQARLNISQSVISEYLKSLEIRLGVNLCQRGPSGFKLFRQGEEIYRAAKRLFAAVDAFKSDLAVVNDGLVGELSIALQDSVLTNPDARIHEGLRRFASLVGNRVRLKVEVMVGFQLIGRVTDGQAHLGIGLGSPRARKLTQRRLFHERLTLYCAMGHPLFDLPDALLTREDIEAHPYCSRGHLEPREFTQADRLVQTGDIGLGAEAQMALILSGRNLGFLPDHVAQPLVRQGHLRPLRPDLTRRSEAVCAITRRNDPSLKVLNRLIEVLVDAHKPGDDPLAVVTEHVAASRRKAAGA